jgi:hypothetical protein
MVEDEEDREDREASAEKNRDVMSARCGSGTELRADEPGALQKRSFGGSFVRDGRKDLRVRRRRGSKAIAALGYPSSLELIR